MGVRKKADYPQRGKAARLTRVQSDLIEVLRANPGAKIYYAPLAGTVRFNDVSLYRWWLLMHRGCALTKRISSTRVEYWLKE